MRQRGFTLIELMMVVVVIGIVCTIAVVSYTKASRKVHHDGEMVRVTAELMTKQESWKTIHGRYAVLEPWPPPGGGRAADMPHSWRQLGLDLPPTLQCEYEPKVAGATFLVKVRCP